MITCNQSHGWPRNSSAMVNGIPFVFFVIKQDILVLTGADAAEGLDPTPLGQAGMKLFRAGTAVGSHHVRKAAHDIHDVRTEICFLRLALIFYAFFPFSPFFFSFLAYFALVAREHESIFCCNFCLQACAWFINRMRV